MLRIVKRAGKGLWLVLSWSPIKGKPAQMFNALWSLGLFTLILLMSWNDGVWNYKGSGVEGDKGIPVEKELTTDQWNAEPLDLGNGKCMIIKTRKIQPC